MQRFCSKLRALAHLKPPSTSSSSLNRFYHSSNFQRSFSTFYSISPQSNSHFNSPISSLVLVRNGGSFSFSLSPPSYAQIRNFSAKSKEKKWKKTTPATSRVKKIKIKGYSSYKGRFRTLNDGTIRRWREGKRHNAHLKSKKAKRRLRKPEIVHLAYAKVMKKLNFCANL